MVTLEMTTKLDSPQIPNVETAMSRRYLKIAQKWFPTALSYFEDWTERPDCGHFFGGVHWYGIETATPLQALAAVSTSPEYDENTTGLSMGNLREIVIKSIRYLCFTHDTGPEECVRPDKGLGMPRSWGTKWGERGKGYFPESQCGPTIANMTTAALMLKPHVDDETILMLGNICLDYLDRFGEMEPKSGIYADTQMEENAWTALGLAACYLFLSEHERAGEWEENAKRWMYSACSAPQDRYNQGEIEPGVTVSRLTGKIFTTLPDYMAENHGMVHPGYTSSGVSSVGSLGRIYRMYGRTEPPHAYWNRQEVYDVIKHLTDFTGTPMPTQGMDRLYLGEQHELHSVAHLLLKDPDAGFFERVALDIREKTQESNKGKLIDPEISSKCHEVEDPMEIKESEMIHAISKPYLLHRMMDGEAPDPTTREEIQEKFNGVKLFPHSGFAFHRHTKGQTSLAWRNYVTALPWTREGVHTIGPSRWSMLAKVQVKDKPESHNLVTMRVNEKDDGFAALMENHRAQNSIRQRVLFASLPDGRILSSEKLHAREDCVVERVEQGFLRIINENFPLVEGNCDGQRKFYYPEDSKLFKGFPSTDPADDIIFDLNDPGWVNVDDRLGIVFRGSGETRYINRHYFPPFSFRAVADDLFLSITDEAHQFATGDLVGELTALVSPEQNNKDTSQERLVVAESTEDAVCMITDGFLCAGNFSKGRTLCSFEAGFNGPIPVFAGVARVNRHSAEYIVPLESGESVYLQELMKVVPNGDVRFESTHGGRIFLSNEDEQQVGVRIQREGKEEEVVVDVGGVLALS